MAQTSQYATLPYDVYVCARHNATRKDAGLVTFYLCDSCASAFTSGAFNSAAPEFEGPQLLGHCALCNEKRPDVRLRQWYLCGVCERVARSIGRARVSARHVLDWWGKNILPIAPDLVVEDTDPVELRRVGASADEAVKDSKADFTATDKSIGSEVLTIELKTGRSAINAMSQFQLDTTDCDDILTVVRASLVPGYVFHAQVVEQFEPPTSYFKAVGLWWTDVFKMTDAFQSVHRRQVEQRYAAYFKRQCFGPMSTFVDEIKDRGYERLADRLRNEGVPPMYDLD